MVIEKTVTLEMAHRLPNHEGKCRNIHGHSWKLSVAVAGPIRKVHDSDDGMVVDFSLLKSALGMVEKEFDHTLVLADYDPLLIKLTNGTGGIAQPFPWGDKHYTDSGIIHALRDIPPTSENLACVWKDMLQAAMPGITIASVTVKETETSEAIWFPEE